MDDSTILGIYKAISLFAFETLARLAEVFSIRVKDVKQGSYCVTFALNRAKTDPFGVESQCLSLSTSTWTRVTRLLGGLPSAGLIFNISRRSYVKWLSEYFSGGITGHSMRRGGAQAMYNRGFPIADIQAKGRWKSQAWLRYVDQAERQVVL